MIDTSKTLTRMLLLGEIVPVGTLVTHVGKTFIGATYPILRWEKTSDGRDCIRIGLWKQDDGMWVSDGSADLGYWSVSPDQDYKNYPHLKTDKL